MSERTRILITNDDGYHSDGIIALEEALKALAAEAVTPDLRRAAKAVSEPEGHVTLDGHHVVERTLA